MEIIFPSNIKCIACRAAIPKTNTYSLCKKCFHTIGFINDDGAWRRSKDGQHVYSDEPVLINENLLNRLEVNSLEVNHMALNSIYSCLKYEDTVKKLIYSFKYSNSTYLSKIFASMISDRLDMLSLKTDYIICVPSSKKRMRERGYDQAELIGRYLSEKIKIPLIHPVIRKKHTKALYGLSPLERELELKDAFVLNETNMDLNYKNLLIIDDILTTGATLEKIAAVIKDEYPSAQIDAIVLADGKKT